MKILFVIPSMSGGGGAERVMSILSNEFSRLGNHVCIAQTTRDDREPYKIDDDIQLVNCYSNRNRNLCVSLIISLNKLIRFIKKENQT